jgi:hypothetical protein
LEGEASGPRLAQLPGRKLTTPSSCVLPQGVCTHLDRIWFLVQGPPGLRLGLGCLNLDHRSTGFPASSLGPCCRKPSLPKLLCSLPLCPQQYCRGLDYKFTTLHIHRKEGKRLPGQVGSQHLSLYKPLPETRYVTHLFLHFSGLQFLSSAERG